MMKTMKFIVVNLILMISFNSYSQAKINAEDLKNVIGNWEGSLTYLNYRDNKPFTMPANLVVKQGKDKNSLVLNNIYPNEPKANGSYKIKLTKNGTLLNKNAVILREELENSGLKIQTQYKGKDDNKKALIRYTYLIKENLFMIRKEVQFEEQADWIKRSEFSYHKEK